MGTFRRAGAPAAAEKTGKGGVAAAVLAGHAAALAAFALAPPVPGLSAAWGIQFAVLLAISALFLCGAALLPRGGAAASVFCVVAGVHAMAEMALGPNPEPAYILAATFAYAALRVQKGVGRFVLVGLYAFLVSCARGPVSAWEADLPAPGAAFRLCLPLLLLAETILIERMRRNASRAAALETRVAGLDKNIDALTSANVDFQEYATRVQREAQQEERARIAREIHDIVGYTLMNLQMMMEAALDMHANASKELPVLLEKARDQTQRGLLETRAAMRELRALSEPESAGMRGLYELARIFENATRVRVEFNPGNFPERFEPALEDLLRRLLQESLTNAFRHGNAETVVVNFWRAEDCLRVAIHDDGAGTENAVPGIGLAGMRERLGALGGELIVKDGGKGFGLTAVIPYPTKEMKGERADQRPAG